MQKKILRCNKCDAPFHFKKPRNWIGRNLLFFLPVKRFFCAKCLKDRYRILTDKELKEYERV